MHNMVDHPDHYCHGGIECIDAIESAVSELHGIEAVCTANAIKYLWRWKQKNGAEDLEKAEWYIDHLLAYLRGVENGNVDAKDLDCFDCRYYDVPEGGKPCNRCKKGIAPREPEYEDAPVLWRAK